MFSFWWEAKSQKKKKKYTIRASNIIWHFAACDNHGFSSIASFCRCETIRFSIKNKWIKMTRCVLLAQRELIPFFFVNTPEKRRDDSVSIRCHCEISVNQIEHREKPKKKTKEMRKKTKAKTDDEICDWCT